VRAAVADAGDLAQFLAGSDADAGLFLDRRSGRGHPVHQEVALLEIREQRLASCGQSAMPIMLTMPTVRNAGRVVRSRRAMRRE
jgi:hypothetical protein